MVKVFAPATIANVTVGFDSLGLAVKTINKGAKLQLGDYVTVENSQEFSFKSSTLRNEELSIPMEDNLVYHAYLNYKKALEDKSLIVKPLSLTIEKNLPIGSGMGSSSCSIVAALHALNIFHDKALSEDELFKLMGEMEGLVSGEAHYDNVAPSFFGGLQLMPVNGVKSKKLPFFKGWYWVVCYPGTTVKTAEARKVIPKEIATKDAVKQVRSMANFVYSLYNNDTQSFASSMTDLIAEPYRESLLPNIENVKAKLKEAGAKCSGISGSGPTYYAIADNLEKALQIEKVFKEHYVQNDKAFIEICEIDEDGAREI